MKMYRINENKIIYLGKYRTYDLLFFLLPFCAFFFVKLQIITNLHKNFSLQEHI